MTIFGSNPTGPNLKTSTQTTSHEKQDIPWQEKVPEAQDPRVWAEPHTQKSESHYPLVGGKARVSSLGIGSCALVLYVLRIEVGNVIASSLIAYSFGGDIYKVLLAPQFGKGVRFFPRRPHLIFFTGFHHVLQ